MYNIKYNKCNNKYNNLKICNNYNKINKNNNYIIY